MLGPGDPTGLSEDGRFIAIPESTRGISSGDAVPELLLLECEELGEERESAFFGEPYYTMS